AGRRGVAEDHYRKARAFGRRPVRVPARVQLDESQKRRQDGDHAAEHGQRRPQGRLVSCFRHCASSTATDTATERTSTAAATRRTAGRLAPSATATDASSTTTATRISATPSAMENRESLSPPAWTVTGSSTPRTLSRRSSSSARPRWKRL